VLNVGVREAGRVVSGAEMIAGVAHVLACSADALCVAVFRGDAGRAVFTAVSCVVVAIAEAIAAYMIIDGAVYYAGAVEAVTYRAFRRLAGYA